MKIVSLNDQEIKSRIDGVLRELLRRKNLAPEVEENDGKDEGKATHQNKHRLHLVAGALFLRWGHHSALLRGLLLHTFHV